MTLEPKPTRSSRKFSGTFRGCRLQLRLTNQPHNRVRNTHTDLKSFNGRGNAVKVRTQSNCSG